MKNIFQNIIPEEYDATDMVGQSLLENNLKFMENGIGKLTKENLKSGLVYGLLWGLLAVGLYTLQVGSVFKLDWHVLVDSFIYGVLGFAISALKNILTTNDGKFAGVVEVK